MQIILKLMATSWYILAVNQNKIAKKKKTITRVISERKPSRNVLMVPL